MTLLLRWWCDILNLPNLKLRDATERVFDFLYGAADDKTQDNAREM